MIKNFKIREHRKKIDAAIILVFLWLTYCAYIFIVFDGKIYPSCGLAGGMAFRMELKKGFEAYITNDWPEFSKGAKEYVADGFVGFNGRKGTAVVRDCRSDCVPVRAKIRLEREDNWGMTGVLTTGEETIPFYVRITASDTKICM